MLVDNSLLRSALIWDNHGCMPLRPNGDVLPQLRRYAEAGVDVVSLNIGMADQSAAQHIAIATYMSDWLRERPDEYRLVRTTDDIERCRHEGKLGIVFDVEGMIPVQDDLSYIETFYELGVRWMLIAYNRNNKAGGGCLDEDSGLTARGREIIDEMERVGMVLCLSHAGEYTVRDALDHCRKPPIFSHSNPAGDVQHARNISDTLIRLCAAKGGVIGLNGFGTFLGDDVDLVARLIRQIRYVVDLVGPEHVGLGLDYVFDTSGFAEEVRNHPGLYPPDVEHSGMIEPEALPRIVDGLADAGFSDVMIAGILGGNWLRVARQVWRR